MLELILGYGPQIGAVLLALGAALGIYRKGRTDANAKHDQKKAKADEKAHDRINKLDPVRRGDDVDIDERLRDLAGKRRDG